MERVLKSLVFSLILLLSINVSGQKKEITKSFDGVERIKIDLATGSCVIYKVDGDKIKVTVEHTYYDDEWEAIIEQSGKKLYLEEDFLVNNAEGRSKWILEIPDDMDVDFNTGTGDLKVEDVKVKIDANSGTGDLSFVKTSGEFELNSGTGDLDIKDSKGEFELNSGTGDVLMSNCSGKIDANSGTGDVECDKLSITEKSGFNSGTGDVRLTLSEELKSDVEINSGTGTAQLSMNGIEPNGEFFFSCKEDDGRIICPVAFDTEDVVRRHGDYYEEKTFTKGSSDIRVKISTGTGRAELEL